MFRFRPPNRLASLEADVPIRPKLPEHNEMGAATRKALIAAGEQAAMEAMPRIRALY